MKQEVWYSPRHDVLFLIKFVPGIVLLFKEGKRITYCMCKKTWDEHPDRIGLERIGEFD